MRGLRFAASSGYATLVAVQVQETQSAFHPHAQRNDFRCRDARLQSRSFARWNQRVNRNRAGSRLLFLAEFLESGIGSQRVPDLTRRSLVRPDLLRA